MTIGERIKQYRNEKNLSQEELSNILNVSRQAVTKWENDLGIPDIDNLLTLSKIMNISVDELLKGDGDKDLDNTRDKLKDKKMKKRTETLVCAILHLVSALLWSFAVILNTLMENWIMVIMGSLCIIVFVIASISYFISYSKMINGTN